MIFKHTARLVCDGSKTQTRRPAGPKWTIIDATDDGPKYLLDRATGRIPFRVGNTYAVQPARGMIGVGQFRLLDMRMENVQDITAADAIAEGIIHPGERDVGALAYLAGFLETWTDLYGGTTHAWEHNPLVVVFEIERVLK